MNNIYCLDSKGNTIKNLYQWDLNQTIYVHGVDTAKPTTFHFCNKCSNKALVVSPSADDTVFVVEVPNILLQKGETLMIYIYQETDSDNNGANDGARTIATIHLPVISRPQPEDYLFNDNVIYATINIVEEKVKRLESYVDDTIENISKTSSVFANALKGSASGEKVVAVNDVSPIEHELDVHLTKRVPSDVPLLDIAPGQIVGSTGIRLDSLLQGGKKYLVESTGTSATQTVLMLYNPIVLAENVPINGTAVITIPNSIGGTGYINIFIGTDVGGSEMGQATADIYSFKISEFVEQPASGVTISRYGKNLFDYKAFVEHAKIYYPNDTLIDVMYNDKKCFAYKLFRSNNQKVIFMDDFPFKKNTQYTIQLKCCLKDAASSAASLNQPCIYIMYSNGDIGKIQTTFSDVYFTSMVITTDASKTVRGLLIPTVSATLIAYIQTDMQIEEGTSATAYEPYIEPTTATADAEGNVNGLTSLSPNMTLASDTDGVIINLEYNRDINKALAELTQAMLNNV